MGDWWAVVAAPVISGLVAIVVVRLQNRSHREAKDAEQKVARRRLDVEGLESLVERLQAEVSRQDDRIRLLEAHRHDDDARINGLEKALNVEERRSYAAIRYIRSLFTWISSQLPGVDPPEIPQILREDLT